MLELKDLHFAFAKKVIFTNLNMTFSPQSIIGIVGKNGIGKTTFFRNLTKIYRPQQGEILFHQQPLQKQQISFLPTAPYFYPYMNAAEYLEIIAADAQQNERSRRIAQHLDLPFDQLVSSFSTGMKKKIAFAAMLAQNRPIQIFDEPFNGVDLESNEVIKYMIQQQKGDKIILLSSHIFSTLTDICDGIFYIEEGFQWRFFEQNEFAALDKELKAEAHSKLKGLKY